MVVGKQLPAVGWVVMQSFAGLTCHEVLVLRETERRYWVRWKEQAFWRPAGHEQFVPKRGVRWEKPLLEGGERVPYIPSEEEDCHES